MHLEIVLLRMENLFGWDALQNSNCMVFLEGVRLLHLFESSWGLHFVSISIWYVSERIFD